MKYRKLPSKEKLTKRFVYDPKSGLLTWKKDHGKKNKAGKVVGYKRASGYMYVYVDSIGYMAHRLVLVMSGCKLKQNQQVDHVNQKRDDNRLKNLRIVDQETNQSNRKIAKNNKTGTTGVYKLPNGKYAAQIKKYGKTIHLGSFATLKEAVSCRRAAEIST